MNSFVADENFDDKRVIAACKAESKCTIRRCPRHLKGKKDYEVVPELLSRHATVVTTDANIVEENREYIPDENPGIVVVRLRRPSQTITTKIASTLLREFKSRFPSWAEIKWRGLYLEITETEIFVSKLGWQSSGKLSISYTSEEFSTETAEAIQRITAAVITK